MSNKFISSIWNFSESGRGESNHNFFRWFGVLPPQLVERLINLYSKENETILANFSGSGTVALECLLNKRGCIAIDSNPLSIMQTRVKTRPFKFNYDEFTSYLNSSNNDRKISNKNDTEEKWFRDKSLSDIYFLKETIINYANSEIVKEYLLLVLASIVKKTSLVDSRCINHIVIDRNKREVDTITEFLRRLEEASRQMDELLKITNGSENIKILKGDARKLCQIPDSSIDLIISHPPYLGNVDYTNINQLENFILGNDNSEIRQKDISTNSINKYLESMYKVFDEMTRVLKPGSRACIIIGDNRKDGNIVPTFSYFIQYAIKKSLVLEDIYIWELNKKAGMNVKRHGNHIDHNYVLIFKKP